MQNKTRVASPKQVGRQGQLAALSSCEVVSLEGKAEPHLGLSWGERKERGAGSSLQPNAAQGLGKTQITTQISSQNSQKPLCFTVTGHDLPDEK